MEMKKVYLVGLGAIGGAYISKIQKVRPETTKIIANRERIERYKREGITINGEIYDFDYITPDMATPADLIIVAVKYHQLKEAIEYIRGAVGPNTKILSLLNGINSEEIIGQEFGMDKIVYGLCVAIDGVREGTNIRYTNIGKIIFGNKENDKDAPEIRAIAKLFDEAGIPYEVPDDIIRSLWWKFMLNIGINQPSAILKAPYKVFTSIQEAKDIMELAMREVLVIAGKEGINLTEQDMMGIFPIFETLSPEGKTSMLQDIEAGRKTEVEMFAGVVCELGQKHGISTPVNNLLFKMIRALEKANELEKA